MEKPRDFQNRLAARRHACVSRIPQKRLMNRIKLQFHDAVIASNPDFEDIKSLKIKVHNIIGLLRSTILNLYFEDDLLLELFIMAEHSIDYLKALEAKYPSN